ncbi:MFS transporter [Subtercola endophyticus]|uniref:MFS transporter n=1 Tax=Subtercola endophyticus TaxID=2895559 RepID=UPI001E34130C|nr:MFS transporter [Subtercola endophyticus]UFS57933.1 MFS transporter [Subtercola endophyticus]
MSTASISLETSEIPASSRDPRARANRARFSHSTGFWVIAAAFLTVMAFSTIPTPLYTLYQARDGFATFMITVIFAAYALGVMAALYLAGHISDWLGRRPVILMAIMLEIAAAIVFLVAPSIPGLLVARVLTGLGVGMLTATATAHLSELRIAARPNDGGGASGTVAGIVNLGGIGLGPLIAGALAQYVVSPLVVPYVVFLVLLVIAGFAVALVPETVVKQETRPAYRPQRISLPSSSRPVFWAAAIGAFAAFAIFGLFTSLAPAFVAGTFQVTNRFVGGAIVFAVFAAAAIAQILVSRMSGRHQLILAVTLMAVGLVSLAGGVLLTSFWMFVLGGIVAGAGVGILFRSAVGTAGRLADPQHRGEVLAALFLVAYAGLAIPALAIGLAVAFAPISSVLVVFAAIILVIVLISGRRMIARAS